MRFVCTPTKIVYGVNLVTPKSISSTPKSLIRVHPNRLIIWILVSLYWHFALVFDVFVPILTLLTFELIVSHHGQILGTKSIKMHKIQAGILHFPLVSTKRPNTLWTRTVTLWKNRHLVYSEGLKIKSILPLLHPENIQIHVGEVIHDSFI